MQYLTLFLAFAVLILAYKLWLIFSKHNEDTLQVASLSNEIWAELHNRDKLGNYLPYYLYDDKLCIYHNNNGTYGIVFGIQPRQISGKQTAEGFNDILTKMYPSMKLQVMYYGSQNDQGLVDNWLNMHKQRAETHGYMSKEIEEIVHKAVEKMANFYKSKFKEPVSNNMNIKLKDFRIYYSVTSEDFDEIMVFKKVLVDILEGNRFSPVVIHKDELKELLWEIFNANHSLEDMPKYDENKTLNQQLIAHDTEIRFTDYYSKIDSRYWVNLSPVKYPDYAFIGDMGLKIGDYLSAAMNTNQFKDNFIITLTFEKQSKAQLSSVKRNHGVILTQSWNQNIFRKFNAVQKESTSILDRIDVKEESLYNVDMNVLVSGNTEKEAMLNAEIVTSYWKKGGRTSSIVLAKTNGIQQLCFLASLPMGADSEYLDTTDKAKSMFGEGASQFVPLECDWKGNGVPNLLLASRRAQLAGFDLYKTDTNFNAYLIATSGGGKSVLLNLIAFCGYTRGDRVFILDYGGSFIKLCEILGGQYIEPDPNKPFSLNPFSEIRNKEHLKEELHFLGTFVYSLGANKNQEQYEKDEKFFKSLIYDIIEQSFIDYGTELEITEIRDALAVKARSEHSQQKILDFCQQLSIYCRGGIYEAFFMGPCAVDFSNNFVVTEIQKIEKEDDIRDAIIMMLTYHQGNAIYKKKSTFKQRVLNIYDEAHKYIGKDPRMDDFIEQLYRRGRKEDNSTIVATQGFEDIYDASTNKLSRAGRAIINSSSWKFFLKQSETSINLLMNAKVFEFSGLEEALLRSAKTVKGEYSEIFMINPEDYKYVYRLPLDKYFYYLSSSDSNDKVRYNTKIAQGMSVEQAINAMIEEDERKSA